MVIALQDEPADIFSTSGRRQPSLTPWVLAPDVNRDGLFCISLKVLDSLKKHIVLHVNFPEEKFEAQAL